METPEYLHLKPGDPLPKLSGGFFKSVLVIESQTTPEWQAEVSDWLVRSGCRYMMACGLQRQSWHDNVDWADVDRTTKQYVPETDFVMTTDHGSPRDAFWFCQNCAIHDSFTFENTYVMHISAEPRAAEILASFQSAQDED